MEKLLYTDEIKDLLRTQVWGVLNGVFIKRRKGTSYIETLETIDNNADKLTTEYYALLKYYYVDDESFIRAYGGYYYETYHNFRNYYRDSSIDKRQVLREVVEAVLELESIGIQYTDIHSKNIMVNDESHMKLVDLDEAHPYKFKDSKVGLLMDLMIECIILFDMSSTAWEYVTPRNAIRELDSKRVYSSSLLSALTGAQSDTIFYNNFDKYIEELMDEEKRSIVRKELKVTQPKYFF